MKAEKQITNLDNKLTKLWLDKISKNENLTIEDLYIFSKIRLKSRRAKKKFNKDYERYISKEIKEIYWGCLIATPITKSFNKLSGFDLLKVEPMNKIPNIELIYFDKNNNGKNNK